MRGYQLTRYGIQYENIIYMVLQSDEYKNAIAHALEKAENVKDLSEDKGIRSGHIQNVEEIR
jgi:hypothetical protein